MSKLSPNENPALSNFSNPFGAIPFDKIKTEHFLPAIEEGLKIAKANLEVLKSNAQAPSFENTMLGLETLSEKLDLAAEIYFNLLSAEADEKMHELAKEISPKLAEFSNDVALDAVVFAKIKDLHDRKTALGLNPEQLRLLEKSYRSFVRNGALLTAEQKDKLRAIDQELSKLGPQFSENVLKSTYAFELVIKNINDLEGLPESAIDAAKMTAKAKGQDKAWIFTLEAPSYIAFVTYAKNRQLRERMSFAYATRGMNGELDNRPLLKRIACLRFERALLLGFETHADYVLQERMAESKSKVTHFLDRILKSSRPAAEKDMAEFKKLAHELDGITELRPWDVAYYSEKLKQKKFDLDEEELRPYFKLENVVDGAFELARKLYGLEFKPLSNIPVYHPDVKVFEVRDQKDNSLVGLFYADFFPRKTKKGGAWMTALREQGLFNGELRRPHVGIVCNFTKPTESKPSLLTHDEVRTLFHEFGHALHGLLSECTYRTLAGTNVFWDFVELPSQIMENWTTEKEALDLFAHHYESGEKIPEALTKKIKDSSTFLAASMSLRQLSYALLDMAYHSVDPRGIDDVEAFEEKVLEPARLLPRVKGTTASPAFSHIFAGGYSAGYYSYKWAEVLDADAFELFKEKGLFNREVAGQFRKHILSRGGTAHPMELYKNFRGREPDPDALLRRDGLIAAKT